MAQQPQQGEIGVMLAGEQRFQVEFHKGRAGEAHVIAQHTQAQPIAHNAPEIIVGAVEEFLHQAVGGTTADGRRTTAAKREFAVCDLWSAVEVLPERD